MKKITKILPVLLICSLFFSIPLPAMACWVAPEPFEIFSGDGSRVFVFVPDENSEANACAAVYEIINNERHLIYTVEKLSSFAYESNFHFSADMTHFARTFNPSGMPVFEVFSNGVKTRTVMRSDFIEDYASEEGFTSIGPMYTVRWTIEEYSPYSDTIAINTDEGNTLFFDLPTAKFSSEADSPVDVQPEVVLVASPQVQQLPAENSDEALHIEPISVAPPTQTPHTQPSHLGIILIAGFAIILIGAGIFFFIRHRKG